jgi:hypothetical protein
MSLEVGLRPQSIIVDTSTSFVATTSDAAGYSLISYTGHGLATDDIIFISSDYSYYNGFWYVRIVDPDSFYILTNTLTTQLPLEYPGINQSVRFYKESSSHNFSSVHLPIIYKLKSNLFPTNSADTARTVNSFSNDNGYTRLNLSGDIKATGNAQVLEFVKLTVDGVEGIYQIINWFSDTSITIDLGYDGGITFGNCQYYYSNYSAKIRIYAGITGTGSVIKPSELITEIEAVPDAASIVTININEYLKNKISLLKNDPAQATMPKDIDSFCEFYIEYTESYDQSIDGYTLGTFTGNYTTDSITGVAVNSKLPFKNRYSGYMSEYLGASRKFLTTMDAPVLFVGNYFDIAFLKNDTEYLIIKRERYLNSSLVGTSYDPFTDYSEGVYRKDISQELTEDRIDVSLVTSTTETFTNGRATDLSNGFDSVTLGHAESTGATSFDFYHRTYSGFLDEDIVIAVNVQSSDLSGDVLLNLIIYNSDKSLNANIAPIPITYNGSYVMEITSSTFATAWIEIALDNGGSGPVDWEIDVLNSPASETKTIEVNSDCANQEIYLTWKNYLGGHDYWNFTAEKDYGIDISDVKETTKNINTNWPNSYNEFADTIKQDISRTSNNSIVVRSQNLTLDQVKGLKYIKTSPLVQIMTSKTDKRTVQVDSSSFVVYNETEKLYAIQFTVTFTDDIPSQSL